MNYGVNIRGSAWDSPMGYESGACQPEGLSAEAKQRHADNEVMRKKQAWEAQQEAKLGNAPTRSEVERALIEQSEVIERLAGVASAMLARLSPVLMDCPTTQGHGAEACQPFSTEIARAINARSSMLVVLTNELHSAYERLGV
jgi:hypothetical protein